MFTGQHIHFVTGRLAEHSLRQVLAELAPRVGFRYSVEVLPITVAALMTPAWIAAHLQTPAEAQRVVLPGYCQGDLTPVIEAAGSRPVGRGPRDLRRLPEFFGKPVRADDYGGYDIEIIAEINHVPRLPLAEVIRQAKHLKSDGADMIDVGCDPGEPHRGIADVVAALKNEGLRVSIDSHNVDEIAAAVRAGAELVLSVSTETREAALDWGCEVVVVPDDFNSSGMVEFYDTIEFLAFHRIPHRIDPVLNPLCMGFAESFGRYLEARSRFPETAMMMGIGNATELVDVDSTGINVLLLAACQELAIHSVLTTQVIHWAQTSVRECDLARRLVHFAVKREVLPKHLEPKLIPLRGVAPTCQGNEALDRLAMDIKDSNYRIFAEDGLLHLVSAGMHLSDADPFRLFDEILARQPRNLDARHAFYLGYEMAKAVTALTLDKEYRQDEALDWGYLTRPETSHRLRRTHALDETQRDVGDA
jgi:dihydropteroate synthase-like protein